MYTNEHADMYTRAPLPWQLPLVVRVLWPLPQALVSLLLTLWQRWTYGLGGCRGAEASCGSIGDLPLKSTLLDLPGPQAFSCPPTREVNLSSSPCAPRGAPSPRHSCQVPGTVGFVAASLLGPAHPHDLLSLPPAPSEPASTPTVQQSVHRTFPAAAGLRVPTQLPISALTEPLTHSSATGAGAGAGVRGRQPSGPATLAAQLTQGWGGWGRRQTAHRGDLEGSSRPS